MFRLDQHAVAVPGRLEQGDEVFTGSMVFPHPGSGGTNVRHLAHATALDALSNGFVAFAAVTNRDFDVRVFNGFRTHVNHKLVGDVHIFEFDLNDHLVADFNFHFGSSGLSGLGCGDLGQLSFPQRRPVQRVRSDRAGEIIVVLFLRLNHGLSGIHFIHVNTNRSGTASW